MKLIASAAGLTLLAAGVAKLARPPSYEALVKDLDWSEEERQGIGAGELAGGLLMLLGPTRRLGAGVVLAASGAALAVELRSGATRLAAPRAGLMIAALLVAAGG